MNGNLEKLGERIRARRLQLGLTQSELVGGDVTRNMLSRIENGAALPSLPTLITLAAGLQVPVGALIGDADDFLDYQQTCELKRMLANKQYAQILEICADTNESEVSDEMKSILCKARCARAEEFFQVGRLSDAMQLLDAAKSLAESCRYDLSEENKRIFLLRMMMEACPALSNSGEKNTFSESSENLRSAVFDNNELAIYLYCKSTLANVTGNAYSEPHPDEKLHRANLKPLIDGFRNPLYKEHIAAKLDIASADYLAAKARLLKLADHSLPPSVLYELYADLEHCCKCCGDFENAYHFSVARLDLFRKIL